VYEPGTLLAGKYRVAHTLGRGGMGVVVAAEHVELRTTVAIKVLSDKYAGRPDVVERFLREARASAQLRSDHVCRVFDVDRFDTGVPYIVMELLLGRDLAKLLRMNGPLDVATATDYVLQACDAVREAHAAHIVHRDLKPGNLFLTQRRDGAPFVKVLDFGVAKAPSDDELSLTGEQTVVGSPSYMAPEQIRASKDSEPRSDIWSLGVILYELVAGRPPFQGATLGDLAVRVATEPFPPLHHVPIGYAMIVGRCLEKDPANRFQTIDELAGALATCVERAPAAAAPRVRLPPPQMIQTLDERSGPLPTTTTLRSASGMIEKKRSEPRRWLVIGTAAAIGIGIGLGVILGGSSGDDDTPAPIAKPTPATQPAPPPEPKPAPEPPKAPEPVKRAVAEPADAGVAPVKPPDDVKRPVHKPAVKPKTKEQVGESRI
jgi:serine/threonine protein kinase